MSDRINRDTSSYYLLLTVGVLIIALAVGVGAFLGWRMSSQSVGSSSMPASKDQIFTVQLLRRAEPLVVTLWYPVNGLLSTGSAAIKRYPDTQTQARETLNTLLTDQRASLVAVLKDVKIQELYLDASGTAYVDLIPNQQKEIVASVSEELLALYAMTHTLVLNFEEIKQVMFLLDGKEARTLAGHIDIQRKFTKRTDLARQ